MLSTEEGVSAPTIAVEEFIECCARLVYGDEVDQSISDDDDDDCDDDGEENNNGEGDEEAAESENGQNAVKESDTDVFQGSEIFVLFL